MFVHRLPLKTMTLCYAVDWVPRVSRWVQRPMGAGTINATSPLITSQRHNLNMPTTHLRIKHIMHKRIRPSWYWMKLEDLLVKANMDEIIPTNAYKWSFKMLEYKRVENGSLEWHVIHHGNLYHFNLQICWQFDACTAPRLQVSVGQSPRPKGACLLAENALCKPGDEGEYDLTKTKQNPNEIL